jgi:hypothetical protein
LGTQRNVNITEQRIYADPEHPDTSAYDVALPVTNSDAVIDTVNAQSLSDTIAALSIGSGGGGGGTNTDITDIKTALGNDSDAASSTGTTLFAKVKYIVQQFLDNWTAARAAKLDNLDNLDTTVSSRAPASTALSNATWTDARAAELDKIDGMSSSIDTIKSSIGMPTYYGVDSTVNIDGTTTTVLNVNGRGRLTNLAALASGTASGTSYFANLEVTLDGTTILSSGGFTPQLNRPVPIYAYSTHLYQDQGSNSSNINIDLPFKTNLTVAVATGTTSGTHTAQVFVGYELY